MNEAGGLFDCFRDSRICVFGTFCPCVLSAKVQAKIEDETFTCCHLLFMNHPFWNRQEIKIKMGVPLDYKTDCAAYIFCFPCAVCQDARIIQYAKL